MINVTFKSDVIAAFQDPQSVQTIQHTLQHILESIIQPLAEDQKLLRDENRKLSMKIKELEGKLNQIGRLI